MITVNLGTGRPYSVLEMVHAFERASGKPVPFEIVGRRIGDLAEYYADPTLAKNVLGWEVENAQDCKIIVNASQRKESRYSQNIK
jgi:UDP-glucose 4-epimerase